ncbi:MAG: hypothetical protein SFY69_08480 [Planctomycetota bacterium]|nr:hypothetical protein [Planctomycetota bacterium]
MLDSIGSAIDTATSALGGNAQQASDVEAVFHIGESLVDPDPKVSGNISPKAEGSGNDQNRLGNDAPTEFVHFGRTHEDSALRFHHAKDALAHAVMFRDGLAREALHLHGSISSAKAIFKEHADAQGAMGMAGAAVDVLMGSGSTGLDASRLDELLNRVTSAGTTFNAEQAKYPDIHKAGVDLHKARANYQDCIAQLATQALEHKSGGGPGGALGNTLGAVSDGVGSAVGGVGGGVMKGATIVQKIVAKPFDIYLSMYLALRDEYEDAVEFHSHALTIKSIRARAVPTFHVWFPPPPPEPGEPPAPPDNSTKDKPDNEVAKAIQKANEAVEKAKKKVEDTRKSVDEKIQKVKDFLSPEAPLPGGPGDPSLDAIFGAFTSGVIDKRLPDGKLRRRQKIVPLLCAAMAKGVGVDSLPGFVTKAVEKIAPRSIALLQFILKRAMSAGLTMDFQQESLRKLGREWFFDTLLDILVEKFAFLQDSPGGLFTIQGQQLTKKAFLEKGRDLMRDKFGQYLEPILDLAMQNMGDRLRAAIDGARDKRSLTMEVLLARLPELTALVVRDTLLPVYDLLFDELFGKAMGAATNAISPVKAMMGDAKKKMDEVKKTKDKVQNVKDKLGEGMNIGLDTDFGKLKDELLGDDAGPGGPSGTAGGSFPGGTRVLACVGVEVSSADIDEVENNQKVDSKMWPDPPKPTP